MKKLNIKEYVAKEKQKLRDEIPIAPSLLIIDATSGDPANQIYIRNKVKDFEEMGWMASVFKAKNMPEFKLLVGAMSYQYDSVIVQMPVRDDIYFDYKMLPRLKDADGLHPLSPVMPATVRGIIDYLDACEFEYDGKTAVVLGRSDIVGKPMAKALLDKNMTVTVCHSHTPRDVRNQLLASADLVVSAVGIPYFFTREQCPKAFVVDVGINKIVRSDGTSKLVGDFVEEKENEAGSTPVPGGVGLLTRLGLMKNCVDLKEGKHE